MHCTRSLRYFIGSASQPPITTAGIYLWNGYKYKEILCGLGVDHLTHVPKTDPMTDEARPLPIALVVVITKLDFD